MSLNTPSRRSSRFLQMEDDGLTSATDLRVISGVVQRGRQLGRTLGYPTANVALGQQGDVRHGVYATETRLPDGRLLGGVANIGTNPTVGKVAPLLEVWLFDFDEDIYGQLIETTLVSYLRPELKFPDLATLVAQIGHDAAQARRILADRTVGSTRPEDGPSR